MYAKKAFPVVFTQFNMTPTYKDLRKPAKLAWQGQEQAFQKETAKILKKALYNAGLPQLGFHTANERKAKVQEHARLKLQGVLSGVSDWIILIPRKGFHGLVIELKKSGGTADDNQKTFMNGAAGQGYLVVLINDLETFEETINAYLN